MPIQWAKRLHRLTIPPSKGRIRIHSLHLSAFAPLMPTHVMLELGDKTLAACVAAEDCDVESALTQQLVQHKQTSDAVVYEYWRALSESCLPCKTCLELLGDAVC